jgi:hypothetical protein
MVHRLTAFFTGIHDNAIAVPQSLVPRDLCRGPVQTPKNYLLALVRLLHRSNVLARHNQNMHRGLRMEIGKGIHQIILKDGRRWNLAFNDLAKYAVHSEPSVTCAGAFGLHKQMHLPPADGRAVHRKRTPNSEKSAFSLDIVY